MDTNEKLVELESREIIPDEVKNNIATQSTDTFFNSDNINHKKKRKEYKNNEKRNKLIRFFVEVSLYIINLFPFSIVFAEVIYRSILNYSYKGRFIAEIISYSYITVCLMSIKRYELSDRNHGSEFFYGIGALFFFILAGIIIYDIYHFFKDYDDINEMKSTMRIIIKMKIYSIFVAIGYDIIIGIFMYHIFEVWFK